MGQTHSGVGHGLAVQQHLYAQGATGLYVCRVGEQHQFQILAQNLGVQFVIVVGVEQGFGKFFVLAG